MQYALLLFVAVSAALSAQAQSAAALKGVVREDSTGRSVAGVDVSIEGLQHRTISDAEGRFQLSDIPAGVRTVMLKRLGYRPRNERLQFLPGETIEKSFSLAPIAAELDTVKVSERTRPLTGRTAFYERKERGFGHFLDSTDLKKYPESKLAGLLRSENSIELAHAPPCGPPYSNRRVNCVVGLNHFVAVTRSLCALKVILDGMVVAAGGHIDTSEPRPDPRHNWYTTFDASSINVGTFEKIEIYRRSVEVPPEYQSVDTDCGLLLLWTKQF